MDISPGTVFSTRFETNCVVVTEPDEYGDFIGKDSQGVECHFSTDMVEDIPNPDKSE